jgi:CHAD domain-containing protein
MSGASTVVRETERKYETDETVTLPDPGKLLSHEAESAMSEQFHQAVYFDTPSLGLLRAGVTLRRREGGHDAGWHLKLPRGGDSRDEVRLPLTDARLDPPDELAGLVTLYARGEALAPVAQLDTHRRRWLLSDRDGRELAELVDDRVEAHTMGEQTSTMTWREFEVELGEYGQPELMDRIQDTLLTAGARRARSVSKLGRVLADRLPPDPGYRAIPARVRAGSAGEAVWKYLSAQADQLRAYDPLARRDAPDAVHQMRVAARRMRSALQAYGRVVDRGTTQGLVEELRWLGRELTGARDSEVTEQRLTEALDSLPPDLVLGPIHAQLARVMRRRHAEGHDRAVATLADDRYLRMHDAIEALLADPPLTSRAHRSAQRELPKSVGKAWTRTEARLRAARRTAPGEEHDRALHETRKAAKRLRYAVEVAGPSIGKPANRLRRALKAVQTVLGEHQDAVTIRPVLRELAVQSHLEGGNGFTYGVLHGQETARAEQAERDLPGAWKGLRRGKNVRWLKR